MYGTHKGWVGWGTPIGPAPIRQRRAAYERHSDQRLVRWVMGLLIGSI